MGTEETNDPTQQVDPRKAVKQYNGSVTVDESSNITRITFDSPNDMLDARYELLELNNPVVIKDDDAEESALIEPNRVSADANEITFFAKTEDEDDDE